VQIAECQLRRFKIPFRTRFRHAAASRSHGDIIIVEIKSEKGVSGFGEIQARPYVTGESNDEIWDSQAPEFGRQLVGKCLRDAAGIAESLGGLEAYDEQPACIGGFDIALSDALDLEHGLDWTALFGPPRARRILKCMTIGQSDAEEDLVKQARYARLSSCDVVKLKVDSAKDIDRCELLRRYLGDDIAIRLDANGDMNSETVVELLSGCTGIGIESIEEPLNKGSADLIEQLQAIHSATGVPIVADESICTLPDLRKFAGAGAYQIVNVRVGKCGGVTGTSRFLHEARRLGFSLVSGTMVGESQVLLRISEKMLHHCDSLDYVEGLDQARYLPEAEVISSVDDQDQNHFQWNLEYVEKYQIDEKNTK